MGEVVEFRKAVEPETEDEIDPLDISWSCGTCGCMTFYLHPGCIECAYCKNVSCDHGGWIKAMPEVPEEVPDASAGKSQVIVDLNDPSLNKKALISALAAEDTVAVFGIQRDGSLRFSFEKPETDDQREWMRERIERITDRVLGDRG